MLANPTTECSTTLPEANDSPGVVVVVVVVTVVATAVVVENLFILLHLQCLKHLHYQSTHIHIH